MRNQKSVILLLVAGLVVHTSVFTTSANMVGGDKDSHGCIWSAGYSWSAPMKKCIRSWEYYSIDSKSPATGIQKLDILLQKKADNVINDFRKRAEELIQEFGTGTSSGYNLDISYSTVNTGSVTSVLMDTYENLGGAHGSSKTYTFNYHTKGGKLIKLSSILSKKELAIIWESVQKKLMKDLENFDADWIREWTSAKVPWNYAAFALHTNTAGKLASITFYLDDGQVAPHVAGRQEITIAYPSLQILP